MYVSASLCVRESVGAGIQVAPYPTPHTPHLTNYSLISRLEAVEEEGRESGDGLPPLERGGPWGLWGLGRLTEGRLGSGSPWGDWGP